MALERGGCADSGLRLSGVQKRWADGAWHWTFVREANAEGAKATDAAGAGEGGSAGGACGSRDARAAALADSIEVL